MERLTPVTRAGVTGSPPPECGPGRHTNFMQLLATSPVATRAYLACEGALKEGTLGPRARQLIALAVAEINGSKYGLSLHYVEARRTGLTDEDIRLARKAIAIDPREDALLRFTRAVALQRGELGEADFKCLRRAGFTDGEVTEIVANIGLNIFVNYFNAVARTEVDYPLLQPGEECPQPACAAAPASRREMH